MSGIAVVTGAAGGMGEAICRRLAADGRHVLVTDIDADAATDLAGRLEGEGEAAGARLDVSSRDDFEAALAMVRERWGEPTILVNNAAITQAADLMTLPAQEFTSVLGINTSSAFLGCQVFGQAMADAGFGRIVNMASLAGQNGGTATGGHYAASKGAILTVTKIFARELASKGVTVNSISPGPHDLPIVHRTVPPEKLEAVMAGIPVGHLGDPEFIADTVALLASDRASFVTGACWDINGGLYLR
ncbi:SDR family NAD(P)-dependent oxidoreductase [Propioniferax innocua]|uniref:3-oxoacyl-[acyl-carrier protein] reductase n=1 Tax=Propioniferax innocua TaxID=1753 RepID=A0A542ZCE3_9ACTN|nr:SDR family oxidoreductase [Propioniferax innocua]TQL58022.1 3-oxoacyl-[acyl-carrier protein] reductase [Propioniferax innocua]